MEKVRKVVVLSLAGMLMGWMTFLFGITISNRLLIVDITTYLVASLLFLASFLAIRNNHAQNEQNVYRYMMIINIIFEAIITYYIVSLHI